MPSDAVLFRMAQKLRRHSLVSTAEAGSGHPTSCMSCAELMAVLFFQEMRFDPRDATGTDADVFVLSKGHAAPILWAALREAGALDDDLLTLRRIDSRLEGHPTPLVPWVRVATGSLGQGLCAGAGMAWARRLDGSQGRVFVLLGDGEAAEGSVWEAAQFASHYRLDNLCAVIDANRLGQSGPTMYQHDLEPYLARLRGLAGRRKRWTATTWPPCARPWRGRARRGGGPSGSWPARSRARASPSSRTRTAGTASR
jgi:transketolase